MYNQAQNRATQKYQRENLEQVAIRVKKGERERFKAIAAAHGLSLAELIRQAVDEFDKSKTAQKSLDSRLIVVKKR